MPTPEKTYYRLGEVAEMLGLPASTIRYWCDAFPDFLTPPRTKGGQRRYTPDNIEAIRRIRELMHERLMSIEGANLHLRHTYRKFPPRHPFSCKSPQDALRLLAAVKDVLSDNAHASAKVEVVAGWISKGAASD